MTDTIRDEEQKKWRQKRSPLSILLTILGSMALIVGAVMLLFSLFKTKEGSQKNIEASAAVSEMQSELAEMQQKMDKYFSKASWNNDGKIDIKEDFLEITDLSIKTSSDIEKGTILSFSVKCNGTDFGLHINGDDELVLLLKDGRSVSGKLSDFTLSYIDSRLDGGREYRLPKLLVADVDPSEIEYIKLADAEIVKVPETYMTVVEDFEFTVFEGGK